MDEQLHQFARWGNVKKVKQLIDQGHFDVDHRGYFGQTALHEAAAGGHTALVKLLIEEYSANTQATNDRHKTPLLLAAEAGHFDVLCYLIENHNHHANADMHSTNTTLLFKKTPLHIASAKGHYSIALYLLERDPTCVHAVDFMGRTSLHTACSSGHVDIVELLLNHGANVNATTRHGSCTPLHVVAALSLSSSSDHPTTAAAAAVAVIHILLSHKSGGANPCCINHTGDTPLHLATSKAIATALLEYEYNNNNNNKYYSITTNQNGGSIECPAQKNVAFRMLVTLNHKHETPVQAILQRSRSSLDLKLYMDSFVSSRLLSCDSSAPLPPQRSKCNPNSNNKVGVMMNHSLNPFQLFLVTTLYTILDQSLIHEASTVVLGFLSPFDVMNQPTDQWRATRVVTINTVTTSCYFDGGVSNDNRGHSC